MPKCPKCSTIKMSKSGMRSHLSSAHNVTGDVAMNTYLNAIMFSTVFDSSSSSSDCNSSSYDSSSSSSDYGGSCDSGGSF